MSEMLLAAWIWLGLCCPMTAGHVETTAATVPSAGDTVLQELRGMKQALNSMQQTQLSLNPADRQGSCLESRLQSMETKLETRLKEIESRLETKLDTTITKLEATETALEVTNTKLETKLEAAEKKLESAETKLEDANTELDATKTALEVTKTKLETKLEVTDTKVEATETKLLTTVDTAINLSKTKLETALEALKKKLEVTETKLEVTKTKLEVTKTKLEVTKAKLETDLDVTVRKLEATETALKTMQTVILKNKFKGGSTFVRWGRKSCTNSSQLVYSGVVGGSWYQHTGAAANALCLTLSPQTDNSPVPAGVSLLYGAEYQYIPTPNDHHQDVPCSVCRAAQSATIMIPATQDCPSGWTTQYTGHLAAGYYGHSAATEYACLDNDVEFASGGHEDKNGYLFYPTVTRCGSLPCPPYTNNKVVLCVVCSK